MAAPQEPLQWGRNLTVAEGSEYGVKVSTRYQLLQWGRNLTVAEGALINPVQPLKDALQWGRNLTVAEGASAGTRRPPIPRLQWGRNLTVAEGVGLNALIEHAHAASMGPQLDSCGRRDITGEAADEGSCFNGAAT